MSFSHTTQRKNELSKLLHSTVGNTTKGIENASGAVRRQWSTVCTGKVRLTLRVNKWCKQTISSTIGLLSDSYSIVFQFQRRVSGQNENPLMD